MEIARRRNQAEVINDEEGPAFGNNRQDYSVDYENQVANLVNLERARIGISPLRLSEDVSYVARAKSQDMRDRNYFSHQSPTYGTPFEMLKHFGIHYRRAGENIARGQRTPQNVMNAWMNSEGHRRNILDPGFDEIGVGLVRDARGNTYWTQLFVTR